MSKMSKDSKEPRTCDSKRDKLWVRFSLDKNKYLMMLPKFGENGNALPFPFHFLLETESLNTRF